MFVVTLAALFGLGLALVAWRTRGLPAPRNPHHAACLASSLCLVVLVVAIVGPAR